MQPCYCNMLLKVTEVKQSDTSSHNQLVVRESEQQMYSSLQPDCTSLPRLDAETAKLAYLHAYADVHVQALGADICTGSASAHTSYALFQTWLILTEQASTICLAKTGNGRLRSWMRRTPRCSALVSARS